MTWAASLFGRTTAWPHVVMACALAVVTACAKGPAAQTRGGDEAALLVKVEPVRHDSVRRSLEVVGTLAAEEEVTVSAQAEGTVSQVLADLGDRVRAGQVLVELDREKGQYAVDQQEASLARALARYGAVDTGHLPPIEQTPDVQRARAELVQAQRVYDRAQELNNRQLVPKQALDDAEAVLRAKQAGYESGLQNARNLRADINGWSASMKLAERQLRDTSIRAPFDGYIQKRLVSLGEFVKNQAPVMSVVRVDPLKVTAEIPEKMAPWIRAGEPVELHVDAFPARTISGRMSRISPAVNPATRAFPFEALVPNADGSLKPGTFARVRVQSGKVDEVTTVPFAAIQYRYGVNRVFVVNGDRLNARELKVGDRLGDRIEVHSGVEAGEALAVTDVEKLAAGQRITVRK